MPSLLVGMILLFITAIIIQISNLKKLRKKQGIIERRKIAQAIDGSLYATKPASRSEAVSPPFPQWFREDLVKIIQRMRAQTPFVHTLSAHSASLVSLLRS